MDEILYEFYLILQLHLSTQTHLRHKDSRRLLAIQSLRWFHGSGEVREPPNLISHDVLASEELTCLIYNS